MWQSVGRINSFDAVAIDQQIFGDVGRRPSVEWMRLVYIHIHFFESRTSAPGASGGCNPISHDGLSREQNARLRMHRSNADVVCTHLALIYDRKTQL